MPSIIRTKEYILRKCMWAISLPRVVWGIFSKKDSEFHEYLYAKWPKTIRIGGEALRLFYSACVAPAFAVMLTLLLVGLVISGKVTVIVSISVFAAWLVASLSVAKSEWMNKQRIGRRLLMVAGAAVLMGYVANRYVRWCLVNYANTQPKATAKVDPDQLMFTRLKELLEGEISKIESSSPQIGESKKPEKSLLQRRTPKPDIALKFVGTKRFAVLIENNSDTLLREPKYWFSLYNLTKTTPTQIQTVPIVTFSGDWLRGRGWMGPNSALGQPQAEATITPNDVLFGVVGASCPDCSRDRFYWLYFVVDQGGWYAPLVGNQVKEGEKIQFDPNDLDKIPLNTRVTIENY